MMRAGLPSRAWRVSRRIMLEHAPVHRERREQQPLQPRRPCARLVMCRNTSLTSAQIVRVGGQQAEVGVQARRARVVVAGAQVRVGHEPRAAARVALAADQQRELRVRLQPEHAVDDLRAGALQPLGPVDVRLLVEARHQLDDDRDFLAAPRRLDQRFHQHRVDAGAVDGLLDRDDVGIVGRAADELDDRLERLVRMVQQDVVLADRREDVGRVAQPRRARPARTART